MTIARAQHWTDEPTAGGRRRTVGSCLNYQDSSGLWLPADPSVDVVSQAPADWPSGWPFPFTRASWRGALQIAMGDNSDAANTCLIGVRSSRRPECGVIFKPLGVQTVQPTVDVAARSLTWSLLWAQSDLTYRACAGRLVKLINLRAPGHPAAFRFVYRLFPGMTAALVAGGAEIRDAQGVTVLQLRAPWGVDAAGNRVRVTFAAGAPVTYQGISCPTFWLTPNASDLASAAYPVTIDPTATISGATNTDDTCIFSTDSTNYGGYNLIYSGNEVSVALLRVAASALPAGTHTALRLKIYQASTRARTISAYRLVDSATWGEGTSIGSHETGAAEWSYAKYSSQAWASGSFGSSDYDADASPPQVVTTTTKQYYTLTLPSSWSSDWKSGSRVANGVALINSGGTYDTFNSNEAGTNVPLWEVDYVTGPSLPVLAQLNRRRR